MDRITLPNGITIESTPAVQEDNFEISQEAFDLLNTYSAESILEAFVACESSGLYSVESEDFNKKEFAKKIYNLDKGRQTKRGAIGGAIIGGTIGSIAGGVNGYLLGGSKKKAISGAIKGAAGGALLNAGIGAGMGRLTAKIDSKIIARHANKINAEYRAKTGKDMPKDQLYKEAIIRITKGKRKYKVINNIAGKMKEE